jgi:lysophospholipase L1-like esterase
MTARQHIFIYGDSLTWGIVPDTRRRLPFDDRWPGVMENELNTRGRRVRVIEDCLNGRRTVWEDPFKPGRNGSVGLQQRMEIHSPLDLVILMLGVNDFQFSHPHNNAFAAAQGIAALVNLMRQAPIEPGMPVPPILLVSPPPMCTPRGPIAPKFAGAVERSQGLAQAYRELAAVLDCRFFDAGTATACSPVDGVHLDADQHLALGRAMVDVVDGIL